MEASARVRVPPTSRVPLVTPGISTPYWMWLRPAGTESITCLSIDRCAAVFWTSTIGDSPVTVSVSWTAPTTSFASTVAAKVP
jgi:hypothetical protein